jgi:large subunit ribosomal protein L17
MRHGKKVNHLGRTSSHRKAMLSNMASSLILSKRITTTVAKAKALRKYVEPLITKAKTDSVHSRRTVFAYLQNKESVKELFGTVVGRTSERPGGYTRIIKMGDVRLGDNAEMCLIELVDFNDIYKKEGDAKKAKTRRGRTKAKKSEEADVVVETPAAVKPAKKAAKKKAESNEDTE